MIAPTPFFSHRGTHIRILEEARALEYLGHDVAIVTYHNGDDITRYISTKIDVRRIRRWLFWYKKTEAGADWQKVLLNVFLIKKTIYMTRTFRPDVVHAHLHEGILIGWIVQKIFFWRKFLLVADFHGSLVNEMRSHGYLSMPPLGTIFRIVEKWINGMGDRAVVSGEENVSLIKDARKDHCAEYVWDGVNARTYQGLPDRSTLRKKYHVPVDAFIVVYTGALIQNKGVQHVLDAIASTRERIADVHFVIGGYPDEWVRAFIKEHGLNDCVTVISPLNYFALAEVNSLSDVAIDPKDAQVQQASGKILQYMAAHVGIICADRPTNHKYLSPDSAQFLSTVDAYTLTEAIMRFYVDRAFLDVCAQHAFRDVQEFDWSVIGRKLDEIYHSDGLTCNLGA
jgi:glycosyltransferase involved in cell wall biosynthesis